MFFFRGLPEGSYFVRIQTTGYAPARSSTLSLKTGFTYLYETAFELSVTEPLERMLLKPPVECPGTARPTTR